jgi:hypothetical protein
MWSKGLGRLQLGSQHLGGLIEMLFATLIAPDRETLIDGRARRNGVCFGKQNPVPEKQILPHVEPIVLAGYDPRITAIFPHASSLRGVTKAGGSSVAGMIPNPVHRGSQIPPRRRTFSGQEWVAAKQGPCYKTGMTKAIEKWLLYTHIAGEFTPLSKPFETKEQAEKARAKYPERKRKTIGLGVILVEK